MPIPFKTNTRTVREVSCAFQYNDEKTGEIKSEQIRVLYYSPTTAEVRARVANEQQKREEAKKENRMYIPYAVDALFELIHSIPTLTDDKGEPHKVTLELLDSFDVQNITAIKQAIDEDISPK